MHAGDEFMPSMHSMRHYSKAEFCSMFTMQGASINRDKNVIHSAKRHKARQIAGLESERKNEES